MNTGPRSGRKAHDRRTPDLAGFADAGFESVKDYTIPLSNLSVQVASRVLQAYSKVETGRRMNWKPMAEDGHFSGRYFKFGIFND
jgi:hypothetical protein